MPTWEILGKGSYNTVYVDRNSKLVLKIQHGKPEETDTPERSVRIWNEINPDIPATITQSEHGIGWTCPYIEGIQASDEEMSAALIDIYNRTGRIIVDAVSPKNFLKTPPPDSQVICVDIGMALQMDLREEVHFGNRIQRKSIVSLEAWKDLHERYTQYFQMVAKTNQYTNTINTVKALLFIKNNRPDVLDATFLKNDPSSLTQCVSAYDSEENKKLNDAKNILHTKRPITLENIKESCVKELERYINSRGSIQSSGEFKPSITTKLFRNAVLTRTKIEAMQALIPKIQKSTSLDDLNTHITDNISKQHLLTARFTSGLKSCLGKCLLILKVAQQAPNLSEEQAPKMPSA